MPARWLAGQTFWKKRMLQYFRDKYLKACFCKVSPTRAPALTDVRDPFSISVQRWFSVAEYSLQSSSGRWERKMWPSEHLSEPRGCKTLRKKEIKGKEKRVFLHWREREPAAPSRFYPLLESGNTKRVFFPPFFFKCPPINYTWWQLGDSLLKCQFYKIDAFIKCQEEKKIKTGLEVNTIRKAREGSRRL